MGIVETTLIYGIVGLAVAGALSLQAHCGSVTQRAGLFAVWTLLWPFFAPSLFGDALDRAARPSPAGTGRPTLDPRLHAAQERLLCALQSVEGVAQDVLASEIARVQRLTGSLAVLEGRLREMDALLSGPEFDPARAEAALQELLGRGYAEGDARVASVRARRRNIEQLGQMRDRVALDLERALLKMEELHSQVLLLRFADRPETELVELVKDIAATVEGLTEGILDTV
jgi:hypothetical protein